MKDERAEAELRESSIREVIVLLDRAMNELQDLGIDIPASHAALAHDLLVERLFSNRVRRFSDRR